jgi:integral membrane protein
MIKFFKIFALLEGISCIALFGNMLFVKHNNPELYKSLLFPIGMTHGMLFIGYIILAYMLKSEENWTNRKFFEVCAASPFPFGTFYIDRKYFRSAA